MYLPHKHLCCDCSSCRLFALCFARLKTWHIPIGLHRSRWFLSMLIYILAMISVRPTIALTQSPAAETVTQIIVSYGILRLCQPSSRQYQATVNWGPVVFFQTSAKRRSVLQSLYDVVCVDVVNQSLEHNWLCKRETDFQTEVVLTRVLRGPSPVLNVFNWSPDFSQAASISSSASFIFLLYSSAPPAQSPSETIGWLESRTCWHVAH